MLDTLRVNAAERFRADGFVIPEARMLPASLATVRARAETIIAAAGREVIPNPHLPPTHPSGVEGGGAEIFEAMLSPHILRTLRELIGPDIVVWSMAIFAKRASGGAQIAWHQDGHYWPMRPLDGACTVWLSLDGADLDNGCVQFVRGSHLGGILHHGLREGEVEIQDEVDLGAFEGAEVVPAVLEPGQMSIHSAHAIHGSQPNSSGRRRAGLAAQFMPASARFDRTVNPTAVAMSASAELYRNRPIWLVSGENGHPDNDFRIGHEGLEALDAIAERVRTTPR